MPVRVWHTMMAKCLVPLIWQDGMIDIRKQSCVFCRIIYLFWVCCDVAVLPTYPSQGSDARVGT